MPPGYTGFSYASERDDESVRRMAAPRIMTVTNVRIVKGYAGTPSGQLHYLEAGSGRPVLLIHPGPASSAMFEPVLPLLAAEGFPRHRHGRAGLRAVIPGRKTQHGILRRQPALRA